VAPEPLDPSAFSDDVLELLSLLSAHQVKYLIVGGEAVVYYGHTRLTGDIDLLYEISQDNAGRLFAALSEFWSGDIPEVDSEEEFLHEGLVVQFGAPPNRVDLVNGIGGVTFDEAWANRVDVTVSATQAMTIHFIGLKDLIRNKKSAGRPKDLEDLVFLRRVAGDQ
jgi:hypothetical protein